MLGRQKRSIFLRIAEKCTFVSLFVHFLDLIYCDIIYILKKIKKFVKISVFHQNAHFIENFRLSREIIIFIGYPFFSK